MVVPFNKPLLVGAEKDVLIDVLEAEHFSANGPFTAKCHKYFEQELRYKKALLTTSCTAALELSALLLDIKSGDEVIIPSYAFVTTANAFASKGATVVFADSKNDHPNIDETKIESLITPKTKAIVALHYGGMACNMDAILAIAKKHSIKVIEDNAQGIGSSYNNKPLGAIGNLGAISFHDTKNVHCGEGGAVFINDRGLAERASILWDMGTNKAAFKSGKVPSYGWVDVGSSFYPSELNAAFLYSQLPQLEKVNADRMESWNLYHRELEILESEGYLKRPRVQSRSLHNAHTFYIVTRSRKERGALIGYLAENGIAAAFHFQPLHQSQYFSDKHDGRELDNAELFGNSLLRLPMYFGLSAEEICHVTNCVRQFYST